MKRVTSVLSLLALSFMIGTFDCAAADVSKFLPATTGIVDIDERQAQLERRIKRAAGSGRLTGAESQTFLDELDKIAELEAAFKGESDSLSAWESLKLLFQLDTLSRRLEQSLRDRTVSSADLDSRLGEIEVRLADARSSRRLTEQEANEFSYEVNRVKALKNSFAADGGTVSDAEALKLAIALDAVSSRLEATMHDRQYELPNAGKLRAELDKRISEGIAAGKIDASEADELKEEFKRIAEKEARLKRLGRPLTSVETLDLVLELDKLSTSIDRFSTATASVFPSYLKRKERIEARIAGGLVSGKLTLAEAYRFKEELGELEVREKELAKSAGDLSASEKKLLNVDLEKIAAALERRLVDTTKTWAGIPERLDTIGRRITAARSKGRLSESEASILAEELKRTLTKWDSHQRTDEEGVYPLNESLAVATSIEQLGQRLSDALHDRSVEIPKLDALKDNLDDRIAFGIINGRFTLADGKRFLDEFDGIVARQMSYQASGNDLTDRERLVIALGFQQLLARVERAVRDNIAGSTTGELKTQLAEQINEGVASGKLTEAEHNYLKRELARVNALETSYAGSGGRLTGREALTVLQEVLTLKASVKNELQDTEIASSDLNRRTAELQQRISTGVTTGKLMAARAGELRKELARIKEMERKYSDDGGVSRGEATTLAYLLEALGATIESSMSDTQAARPNITRMEEEIDRKLANAVVEGTINLQQVDVYTAKLEDIARLEMSFRYSGDGLSFAESATLKNELDKLDKAIDADLASGKRSWTGLDDGIEKTARRIEDGIEAKKLTGEAAANLKTEIDRIQKAKIAFAHSQGGYDLGETESLVKDLDRLNAELDLRLKGQNFAWSDIDRRQQSVELQIKSAIKTGKLNATAAKQVQDELERIKRAKAAFTVSDGNLNYFQRVSLAGALDKLDDLMKKKTTR